MYKKRPTNSKYTIIFLSLFILFVSNCAPPYDPPQIPQQTLKVAILGDSISSGVNADYNVLEPSYGWVHMLNGEGGGDYPAPKTNTIRTLWSDAELHNFAVSGTKAAQWNNEGLIDPVLAYQPDYAIVFLGANDVLQDLLDGDGFTSEEEDAFQANLEGILQKLRSALPEVEILLVNYYDLFDGSSDNIAVPDYFKSLSTITTACIGLMRQIAEVHDCCYVDVVHALLQPLLRDRFRRFRTCGT